MTCPLCRHPIDNNCRVALGVLLPLLVLWAALVLAACSPPSAAPPLEPEPEEAPFLLHCAKPFAAGMTIDEVEANCGKATSKLFTPQYPDATALRWCQTSACRQMYLTLFWEGKLRLWGRAYEVLQ